MNIKYAAAGIPRDAIQIVTGSAVRPGLTLKNATYIDANPHTAFPSVHKLGSA